MKKPLIILTGPTAVGKTKLSIDLAKRINGEIISADSMQVYQYMNIGTAKITKEEMDGVKHYLIDELDPFEDFSVNHFQQKAKNYMDEIYSKNKIPMIVGGTGFYIQSVLYDIDFSQMETLEDFRNQLYQIAHERGNEYLHQELAKIDPQSAEKIAPNNIKRIVRAMEYYKQTGQPISQHNQEQSRKESPYKFIYLVLANHREILYDNINRRVDIMIEQGLVEEVRKLMDMGLTKDHVSMKGIGYKEILDYLYGETSYEESIEILKQNTRRFAKRQLTWFRREKDVTWIDLSKYENNYEKVLENVIKMVEEKGIL